MWTELWQFFPDNDFSSSGLKQPVQLNLHNPRALKLFVEYILLAS